MRVIITRNGETDLEAIYRDHADYSFEFADRFHDRIVNFMIKNLSQHPKIGRALESPENVRKLVYDGAYNIYYTLKSDAAYILYILDGRRILNDQLLHLNEEEIENLI